MLDANFMASRALIYDPNAANAKEVNLSKLNTSRQAEIYKAKLDANGNLAGSANCSTTNQLARIYKEEHAKDADNNKTIEALEEVNDFSISDYKVVGMDSTSVIQNFNFEKECNVSADGRITLNPSIAPMLPKNPFTDKERLLPVEFDSPSTYVVTTMIELPEGYMAEELPKPISMMACNGKLSLKYTIVQQDSRLVLNFNYSHKDTFFPKEDYEHISYFYTELSRLSNLQIVIKKGS